MSHTLPPFDEDGLLPEGDYSLTLLELKESTLLNSLNQLNTSWDYEWRSHLINNLEVLVKQLWQVDIMHTHTHTHIYIYIYIYIYMGLLLKTKIIQMTLTFILTAIANIL